MKNIFSKTSAEKRTQIGIKSYSFPTRLLYTISIFAFLTLGVGQMWGDTNRVVYCAISDATKGSYTLKVNANIGDNNTWRQYTMSLVSGKTFNGKKVYTATVSEKYGGVDALQFQLYDGSTWKAQKQPISSWSTSGNWAGKICEYEAGTNGTIYTYTPDTYYLEGNTSWISSGWNANAASLMTDNGDYTWSKTVTSVGSNSTWHVMKVYGAYGASGTIWRGVSDYSEATHPNITATQGSDNFEFKPALSTSSVTVTYDALAGTFSVTCAAPTITFDREGGSGGPASQNTYYNEATSSITAPTKSYHDFGGYWTGDDGTGTQVIGTNGAWIKNVSNFTDNSSTAKWIVTANYILHAKWTPKNYSITYKDQGNVTYSGSNGGSLPTSYTYGTGIASLTDGVKSGYRFDGWFTTSACTGDPVTTISTSANGNKIFYAKWTENPGGTVSLTAGTGGEVSADNSSWGTSKSHTGIKSTTPLNIYARANSGYTFNTWTKKSGSGTITTNAASGVFTPVADADAALTASFTETKVTLTPTVSYDHGSSNYTATSSNTVGVATTTNLSCSAPTAAHYTFAGWTLTNLTVTSGNPATDRSITVKITTAGSPIAAVANYNEVLTSSWYVNSDASSPFTGWGTSGNRMQKKSGHSTEEIYYKTLTITTPGDYGIKMYNDAGSGNKYYQDKNNSGSSKSIDVASCNGVAFALDNANDKPNMTFKAYLAGDYEFKLDNTGSSPTLTITWPEINQVRISAASPADAGNVGNFDLSAPVSNVRSKTLSLKANTTYTFKIVSHSDWYGFNSGTFTRSNSTSSNSRTLTTSGGDMTLTTDYAGDYTFKFNESTKALSIDFPTAYKITWGVGTVKGGNKYTITCKKYGTETAVVSNSTWIKSGDKVTFYAGNNDADKVVNDGYTWRGYYSEAAGTTQLSNQTGYSPVINAANMSFYACFYENDYTVTVNAGTGGKVNSLSSTTITGHKDTKANLPIATADPGYYFVNWTTTTGTLYNSTNASTGQINGLTSIATVTANFAPIWTIAGLGGDWNTNKLPLTSTYVESTVNYAYLDIDTLRPNTTYYFKAIQRSQGDPVWWRAENASDKEIKYTNSNTRLNMVNTTGDNFTMKTAGAGRYTFDVNLDNSKHPIKVHYPTSYTVTFGSAHGTVTATVEDATTITTGQYAAEGKDITFTQIPATGYLFKGWYNAESEGSAIACMASDNIYDDITDNIAVYAQYNAKTYTVTLDQQSSATGYGSSGDGSLTATFDAAFPSAAMPTAANGYAFMGYWSAANGTGTQFTDASGNLLANITDYSDASGHWKYDASDLTLYAYYKKAEITAITLNSSILDPVDAGGTGWVIANPTVEPTPVLPVKICWELLYDNDNPVPAGHKAQEYAEEGKPNQVRFSIAGLAASRYKIKATLRTGSSCDGGTELSTFTQTFTIASSFTVTILYQDDDNNNIAPGTTSPGKATDWTTISAPDIFGYSFVGWNLGAGITTEDLTDKQNDFRFKASYYGTIVAQYTKNQYIYLDLSQDFSTYGKWNNPYVYFYNGDPWVDNKGAGAKDGDKTHTHYISGHAMTKIDGTDIWYFDYGGVSGATQYVAFTWGDKTMQENFNATDVIFRGDFSESTPLFVPTTDGTAVSRKTDVNGAQYYNKGYWVTYLGEPTGYTLLVYNSAGNVELKREPFIAADKRMTMISTVQLDASSTYKIEVLRNDGYWYKAASNFTASSLGPKPILPDGTKNAIQTNADGIYTFTLDYISGNLQLSVVYPSSIGDFRIAYTDNATWSHSHTLNSWILPSKTIVHRANGVDTVSFFISKGAGITPKIRWQKVTAVSTSLVTWGTTVGTNCGDWLTTGYTDVSEAGVYNFKVTQNADGTSIASIERIGAYDGSYYIRCNALRSKWDHYTIDSDHRMTYSEFSESAANSFGEKYSHYKAKWCPRNTNIAFVIANDYSPCLTDKLTTDVGGPAFNNLEADGTLKYEKTGGGDMKYNDASAYLDKYSANVRFMWNRKTNKTSRAYVSAATSTNAKFLVLQGSGMVNSNIYNGTTGSTFATNPPGANSVILKDDQNWIYEEVIKANPSALVKLYANYCDQTQWFRGASGTPFAKDVNAIELLGGSSSSSQYSVRVIYDFKTNRLVCAWMPEGASQEIETNLTVNADVMVVREHQGSAQCITFANDKSMTGVKTVYGAMKFNRWILSNRAHPEDTNPDHCRESNLGGDLFTYHSPLPIDQQLSIYERSLYFISFPFDVKASEIFGFGHYWDEWYLEYYDGETRAKNGYWKDSPANWKYVTPDMLEDFTLKANEGYILGLDLDFMKVDNTAFWSNGISTVELYFPSTVNLETLQQTNVTIPALSSDYKCTINRGTPEGDRRVKDSYWRCLGVPSFNIYNSALKDGSGKTIEWKTDYTWHADESEFPFIYMWNKADNTLTPQATSTFTFLPMHAYLVQNGGAIHWTAVSAKPSSIVARRVNEQPQKEYNWDLTLVCDSQLIDRTYIRMSNLEQVTDSFDFGQDLNKEFNSNRSDIYTYIGYEKVAANSMPIQTEQTTIVAVGVKINTAGEYTFAMPDTYGVDVTLIDTETGVRTHLGLMDYTVTLAKGDYTNRFILEISPVSNTPTDIELINGENGDASLDGVRKVLIDNKLFLIKGDKVYDATGRCIN